jgi:hypothetical protein
MKKLTTTLICPAKNEINEDWKLFSGLTASDFVYSSDEDVEKTKLFMEFGKKYKVTFEQYE